MTGISRLILMRALWRHFLNKASAITASDEVTEYDDLADFGLDDPANTVTLKQGSGLTTIYIGSQNEITNEYYLKTGRRDTIYVVDSSASDRI